MRIDTTPLAWATACLVLWAQTAQTASAQQSPWSVGGSVLLSHDANLLRLADTQDPGPGESRADTVLSTALVGSLNQNIGRQRVFGNLTVRDNRFEQNPKYNNQSYNGQLGLDWSTVARVSGQLSASAARALSTFNADGVGLLGEKNLESTRALNASVSVGLVTQYSLELGAGKRQVRNSLQDPRVLARDYDQDTLSAGLAWRPSAALSLSAALRQLNGKYPSFRTTAAGIEADTFKQQQLELGVSSQATGASTIDLRLSFGNTRYEVNEQRNFSSVNGSLGWLWQATGKLRLNTRFSRDQGQDAYPSTAPAFIGGFFVAPSIPVTLDDKRVISTLRVQADLEVSAKVALTTSLQHSSRKIDRTIVVPVPFDELQPQSGRDSTTVLTLGARWAPLRNALVGCDFSSEKRRASGNLSSNLHGSSFGCYGQISLQ